MPIPTYLCRDRSRDRSTTVLKQQTHQRQLVMQPGSKSHSLNSFLRFRKKFSMKGWLVLKANIDSQDIALVLKIGKYSLC